MNSRARAVVQKLSMFAVERGVVVEGDKWLEKLVEDLLFGERALWQACQARLVTSDEVVDALLDRFMTQTFGVPADATMPTSEVEAWSALRAEVLAELFRDV